LVASVRVGNKFAKPAFAFAAGVHIRRVEKIPTFLAVEIENLARRFLVRAPTVSHHAEAERRNLEARAAERAVFFQLFSHGCESVQSFRCPNPRQMQLRLRTHRAK